ncbi:SCO2322 family protein [Actinopolymorpha singaporensis]
MRLVPKVTRRSAAAFLLTTLATVLAAGLLATTVGAGVAQASAYRYWGFFQWKDNAWKMASVGPGSVTPKDGAVDGWRFAVSGEKSPPRLPRAAADFAELCGSSKAQAGKKRVGVVLDYGVADEAPGGQQPAKPRGACAVVDAKATSAQVLAAVADVREQKSMVCGIDGFPSSGCGDPVKKAPAVASPEPTVALALPASHTDAKAGRKADAGEPREGAGDRAVDAGSGGLPVLPVVAVIVVLLGGGLLLLRRRRNADQGA